MAERVDNDIRSRARGATVLRLARRPWRGLRGNRLAQAGAAMIVATVGFALLVPLFTPDPLAPSSAILSGPSSAHLFGTDQFGRDLLEIGRAHV